MDTVFFIEEKTERINIELQTVNVTTNFVVRVGYKEHGCRQLYSSSSKNYELKNYVPGVWWKTQKEAEKNLAYLMKIFVGEHVPNFISSFNALLEKYPEAMI